MKRKLLPLALLFVLLFTFIPIQPAYGTTKTMTITADRDKFKDNYGGSSSWQSGGHYWLYVGHSGQFGIQESAIRFNVSTIPDTATSVKLCIPISYSNTSYDNSINIFEGSFDSWDEEGDTMPSAGTLIATENLDMHSSGEILWKYYDVTSFCTSEAAGDGLATFLITGATSGESFFSFYSREDSTAQPHLDIEYIETSADLTASTTVQESSLEACTFYIELDGITFDDSSLAKSNFNLSTSNISIASLTYIDSNHCEFTVNNNLADFDSNYSFNVTIAASELSSTNNLSTNSLNVYAYNDSEVLKIDTDGSGIYREAENGEQIFITLSGGVFSASLNSSNWSLINFPSGVSIGSISRTDDTHATITLSGNSVEGPPISDVSISCNGYEYDDGGSTLYSDDEDILAIDDDPPYILTNIGLSLDEGETKTITTSMLQSNDPDSTYSTIRYHITSPIDNGTLLKNYFSSFTSFTQQDIDNGIIKYRHDGTDTTSDSFTFKLVDDGGNELVDQVFIFTINAVDDECPTMINKENFSLDEGSSKTISNTILLATDVDSNDSTLEYTITHYPQNGKFINTADPNNTLYSFTQQDINDGVIKYVHDDTETTSDDFTFKVADGAISELTNQTVTITINPVDDNPPSMVNNTGFSLNEGDSKIISSSILEATDLDSTDATLVYTITIPPSNGHLEVTLNPGFAISSFSQQSLNNSEIVYIHDGTDTTSDYFGFKVADSVPNELTGQVCSITVNAINDEAPNIINNNELSLKKGASAALSSTNLSSTDADSDDLTLEYTLTQSPQYGQLESLLDPGTAISSFTQQDINDGDVIYVHSGTSSASDSFIFKVADSAPNELTNQIFNIKIISPTPVPTPKPATTPAPSSTRSYSTPTPTPEPSTSPSPTLLPAGATESPTAVAKPAPSDETEATITPKAVQKDEQTGEVTIEITVSDLPQGTSAIRLSDGTTVAVDGQTTITIVVSEDDLDDEGKLDIFILDDELLAFGNVSLQVEEPAPSLQPETNAISKKRNISTWLLLIAGLAAISVIWSIAYIAKKRSI